MDMAIPRELRKYLENNHFELARETNHYVYRHRSGRIVVISKTCSDGRAMKNALKDVNNVLKEAGLSTLTASALGV